MNTPNNHSNEQAVLGQKCAFATASLLLGIASFISLLGLEKGILAVLFGILALKTQPLPSLARRRAWGKPGIALGALHIALVVTVVLISWRILVPLIPMSDQTETNPERGTGTDPPHPSCGHPLPIRWGEGRGEGIVSS